MKYIKQITIILAFSLVGELLHGVLPLPVPASIYGLLLLLLSFLSGVLPLNAVKESGVFLVEIMPLMFIPSAVGLLESWNILQPLCLPYLVITAMSTLLVMVVSGRLTQAVIRRQKKGQDNQ